jgi:hypothetical protein
VGCAAGSTGACVWGSAGDCVTGASGWTEGEAAGAGEGCGAFSEVLVTVGTGRAGAGLAARVLRQDDSETASTAVRSKTHGKPRVVSREKALREKKE